MQVKNQRNLESSQNKKTVSCNVTQLQLVITSSFEIEILSSTPCLKGYKILQDFGVQSSSKFPLEVALKSKLVQVARSVQNWVSAAPSSCSDHNS
jgi:hypothetical protein